MNEQTDDLVARVIIINITTLWFGGFELSQHLPLYVL